MATEVAVLSSLAADAACERLRVALPPLLTVLAHGARTAELAADLRLGWQELDRDGHTVGPELAPFLVSALHVLNRPELQLSIVIAEADGSSITGVLAASGDVAVLGQATGGGIRLESVPRSGLARIAVGLVPELAPGSGQSVNLPSESVEAAVRLAAGDPARLGTALREGGLRDAEARSLAGVLGVPRVRAVQFGGRGFDGLSGRANWSPVTVDVIDTAAGRYFAQHRRGQDGRRWFTLAPTDRRRLVERVGELLRQVQPTQ